MMLTSTDAGVTCRRLKKSNGCGAGSTTWVVVKMMVPFWIPIIIRHLIFRVSKKGPYFFDDHPRRVKWESQGTPD